MTFLVESVIACLAFTLMVFLMSRDPIKVVFNYPPVIIDRCRSLGLVDDSNRPGGPVFYAKKLIALLLFGVLLGLLVRYVNGCTSFWCGVLTAYALWNVVNWFDALVANEKDDGLLAIPTGRKLYGGEIFPAEVYLPPRTAMFEGIEVRIPNQVETYLINLYGKNYMQLPPIEKRERHFIVDFDLNSE